MVDLLRSYLLQRQSVSIPGMGTIYVERIPAQSDFVNRQILPPAYHYRFDRYFDAPAREFFLFLAAARGEKDFEAVQAYNAWAQDLRRDLESEGGASLEGIGVLQRDETGNIHFEPAGPVPTFDAPVPATRIIRTDSTHRVLVGDRERSSVEMTEYFSGEVHREKASWWIYALVLAALALLFLFFHYYQHGQSSPFGNQQKVQSR